jgi:glycosyltransferase involved in cell wall biosynthesis
VPIALVITDLDVGGAERAMVALATGLDRSRWAPSVVCLGPEGALVAPLRAAGIAVTCLGVDRRRPFRAVVHLASALRTVRPALVQSFLFHANVAAKLASPLAGRPWVVGGIRVAERERRWHRVLERATQRRACGMVCVSEGVRNFSVAEAGLDPDRLVVIQNGIDAEPYDRAVAIAKTELGLDQGNRVALFVGRLTWQKGAANLIGAFGGLAEERPDWRLLLVGDGPLRGDLEHQSRDDPRLAGRIHFLGKRDDVPSLLKTADLLVLSSLYEGMPNVVLEAMAASRAVCATHVEGIDELVVTEGPDRNGWVAPGVRDLPEALLLATADDAPREQLGANGRARIARNFAIGKVIASYEKLWAGVLGFEFKTSR